VCNWRVNWTTATNSICDESCGGKEGGDRGQRSCVGSHLSFFSVVRVRDNEWMTASECFNEGIRGVEAGEGVKRVSNEGKALQGEERRQDCSAASTIGGGGGVDV